MGKGPVVQLHVDAENHDLARLFPETAALYWLADRSRTIQARALGMELLVHDRGVVNPNIKYKMYNNTGKDDTFTTLQSTNLGLRRPRKAGSRLRRMKSGGCGALVVWRRRRGSSGEKCLEK